jgi:GT2 family glycosyltransferase
MLEEIKEANFFDNDFHIFFEDLDIAWRAQRAGWKGYYVPDAVAYHVRGATVRSQAGVNKPAARRFLSSQLHGDLIKNRYLTMVKNESALSFFLHLPFLILYDVIMWGYIILFCPRQVNMLVLNTKYLRAAWNKRKRLI